MLAGLFGAPMRLDYQAVDGEVLDCAGREVPQRAETIPPSARSQEVGLFWHTRKFVRWHTPSISEFPARKSNSVYMSCIAETDIFPIQLQDFSGVLVEKRVDC